MKSKASETAGKRTAATSKAANAKASKTSKKAVMQADPLASCPVDGAGWCPYPFSIAQLKKRLKAKAAGL